MDVLRPPLVWAMGQCYRKNLSSEVEDGNQEDPEDTAYHDECGWNDEVCDSLILEETDSGFRYEMSVPSAYFKFIIGKKAETKRRLENETATQIRIPKPGQDGPIVILSRERRGVVSAKTRIDVMVDSARQRQPFTHFLSFPVNGQSVKDSFMDFKHDVLRECDGDRGLDDTLFQNSSKLHLTLGTLVLLDDAEVQQAEELLQECKQDLIGPVSKDEPLKVYIQGLEYMNDDPNAVDVLYAKVELEDESDRLQILCDRLVDKFVSSGLMHRDSDRVKIHVTVMNTMFRKDPSGAVIQAKSGQRGATKERVSFDASNVLRLFGNYSFGQLVIGQLHLSQRYSTSCDGYYQAAAVIDLPS
ncbi:activating signal cointegrator 1 complex subunit 1-like isoform X2 [Lineus longissimus]